jgi:hypothetical protein
MAPPQSTAASAADDEDDDYMNMTFDDPAPVQESSVQRARRLKMESRARGIHKSNAQLAEEEIAGREKALATSMLDDPKAKKSKGFAMMAKMGFSGGGLGKKDENGVSSSRLEPINISIKDDRGGIGLESEKKRKFREAAEEQGTKTRKLDPDEYRERVRKEREDARIEKQLHAAQRMAERLDEDPSATTDQASKETSPDAESKKPTPFSSRPLKAIPVFYRDVIRHRAEVERDRRMRHDLQQSLPSRASYNDYDEDEDDKKALGKSQTIYADIEDLEEEDEELDEFNALELSERLRLLLVYLRSQHRYCFWCKTSFPDSAMEGCPGITEEDHD